MSEGAPKTIVREALERLWRTDPTVFAAHPGLADTRRSAPLVCAAFPDIAFSIERQLAEGDSVATYGLLRATHTGALMGIAPTGKRVEVQYLSLNRVAEGKVVGHNSEVGWLSVPRQLGVLPLPAGGSER